MSIIKILPENISNLIAAGEVIERPASVVKELIENSLDAGAEKILVNIEQGGIKLISVSDNGCGMDPDDVLICLEPHATSKIFHAEDIDRISTLGFRGEALPSIASISRFHLRSRKKNDVEGTEVIVEGGKFINSTPVGCAPGTEVIVRDIFFNIPARRKFLRSQSTEERHIQEVIYLLALAYPSVTFELHMDGRNIFSSPSDNNLLSRIRTFFGKTMANDLISIEYTDSGISVGGYIARHGFTKSSRHEQRVFVNRRPVESLTVYSALRDGYGSLVAKGRFPPVIFFLNIEPVLVDVNVHPAKKEVRFRKPNIVNSVIIQAVRTALRTSKTPTTSIDSQLPLSSILSSANISYAPKEETPSLTGFRKEDKTVAASGKDELSFPPEMKTEKFQDETAVQKFPENETLKILAFLDESYILASSGTGLIVIDQHAAHERILFEEMLSASKKASLISQKLLIPVTLEFSRAEILFLGKNKEAFASLGFEIESFGQNTVIINAIPAPLPQDDIAGLFSDILSALFEESGASNKIDEVSIARAACSHAVKAHDKLTMKEAEALIRQMADCELPFSCPHGRPTMINISYKELEKRFGRRR